MKSVFVSDLHGNETKYRKLVQYITENKTELVFIGGDVLPNYMVTDPLEFITEFLKPLFADLKNKLNDKYPAIFLITGNDDPAVCNESFRDLENNGLLHFVNEKIIKAGEIEITGYPFVPPTPFLLKDFEKYDVSQFTPRGSVSPEEGIRTADVVVGNVKYASIKKDLDETAGKVENFKKTICLFHSPPYNTYLDKMIGKSINGKDEVISVGSIAMRKFIEKYQPLITLHGHIHESSEISGSWKDKIGETYCFNAAYNGNELAAIRFDTNDPGEAERILI